jgi:hypothetical protein
MLDHPSQLNVYADNDAKWYLWHLIQETNHHEPSTCFQEIFKEGWSCWLNGKKVTSNAELALKEFIFGNRFREHCHLKKKISLQLSLTVLTGMQSGMLPLHP